MVAVGEGVGGVGEFCQRWGGMENGGCWGLRLRLRAGGGCGGLMVVV